MPQAQNLSARDRDRAKHLTQTFQVTWPLVQDWRAATDDLPGAGLAGVEEGVKQAGKAILEKAPQAAGMAVRGGKAMIGAPGKLFDAAQIVNAKDRKRALAGYVGGWLGGAGGGAVGELAGPPGAIAGAAVGNYAGARAGEYIYDHYAEIPDRVRDAVTSGWGASADPTVKRVLLGPRW